MTVFLLGKLELKANGFIFLVGAPGLRLGNQQLLPVWDFLLLSVKGKNKGIVGAGRSTWKEETPPCYLLF